MLYDQRWDLRTDTVSLMLWEAADILADNQLHKGGMCSFDENREKFAFCCLGAIYEAFDRNGMGLMNDYVPAFERVSVFLDRTGRGSRFESWGNVPLWNDAPARTKQEVVDVLRGAACYVE